MEKMPIKKKEWASEGREKGGKKRRKNVRLQWLSNIKR